MKLLVKNRQGKGSSSCFNEVQCVWNTNTGMLIDRHDLATDSIFGVAS